MLIKIKTPGWEHYTGELGMAHFENGVSVEAISTREAYSLGSYLEVVEIDENGKEGNPVSHAFDIVRQTTITAPVLAPRRRLSEIQAEQAAKEGEAAPAAGPEVWTQEALEKIAEEQGIAGIRTIADPLGVKGTAIKTLIAEILANQPRS